MRPRIFVGSSREAIDVCRAVQLELADDFDVTVWDQDVFRLSYSALDSLLEALESSDAGVFVLRPDDITISRDAKDWTARDNVIFELGMFIGRLGRDRTFMLAPYGPGLRLPSDLLGITTASYEVSRTASVQKRATVGPACTKIRAHLAQLRLRVVAEPRSRARLDEAMGRMSRDPRVFTCPRRRSSQSTSSVSSLNPSLSGVWASRHVSWLRGCPDDASPEGVHDRLVGC